MNKILINFAHPAKSRSRINRSLRAAAEKLEGVTINDLYAHYPDFLIDVRREQKLCEQHDVIIFQHPLYWYSTPAIMKEWLDLVLQHGWAYGTGGMALNGKIFFQVFSAGGDASSYQRAGANQFTLAELTSPYQATAHLCQMVWLPPFAVTGVHRGLPADAVRSHAQDYQDVLVALRDSLFDIESAQQLPLLNTGLPRLIKRS